MNTSYRISDEAQYANIACLEVHPLPPLREPCTCEPGMLCPVCYEHEQCGRISRKKLNRSIGVRMSLLTPEEEYIQHMVKQMRAWQSANGHTLWLPSLHHLQGHQGLPSRRAIQSHLGSSERVYQLWLEHGLISAARHAELMLQIVPAHAKVSFEEFFLERCRQWQQRNGRLGWMPVISHFNKYASLPSTRAIRNRYATSLEVYDLFYREGLITRERYDELRLISEMKTNAVLARKGRQNDLGRNLHNSQQAAD